MHTYIYMHIIYIYMRKSIICFISFLKTNIIIVSFLYQNSVHQMLLRGRFFFRQILSTIHKYRHGSIYFELPHKGHRETRVDFRFHWINPRKLGMSCSVDSIQSEQGI